MFRGRFRYSLRLLLLVTLVVAAVAGVVGTQLKGRVQQRGDPGFLTDFSSPIDFSTGLSPTLGFSCATKEEAGRLLAEFDEEHFRGLVNANLKRVGACPHQLTNSFYISCGQAESSVFIKYDFSEWGRYRLDLRHVRYSFDMQDPVADSLNAAVHRAFQQAGKVFAENNPSILEWGHIP